MRRYCETNSKIDKNYENIFNKARFIYGFKHYV